MINQVCSHPGNFYPIMLLIFVIGMYLGTTLKSSKTKRKTNKDSSIKRARDNMGDFTTNFQNGTRFVQNTSLGGDNAENN